MELETKQIHKNKTPQEVTMQLIVEEDYNLPEYKKDIVYVIKSRGTVKIEEIVPEEEYVSVKGKVQFAILYQGEAGSVDGVCGEMPFAERVHIEGGVRPEDVSVRTQMEDLGVVVINSRKLSLRGLADLMVCICEGEELDLPLYTEYPAEYQIKKEQRRVLKFVEKRGDRLRFKQEVTLPKEKPDVRLVLWQDVKLEQMSMRQNNEGVEITGMLCLFALYEGAQGYAWYETSVPVSMQMDCDIPPTDGFFQIKPIRTQASLEPREDLDGEMRNLAVEYAMEVELFVWQEEEVELLQDAYCMARELHVHRHEEELWQMAMKNEATFTAEGRKRMDTEKEVLYLYDCQSSALVQEVQVQERAIHIKGMCEVEVLYGTSDEMQPFANERLSIPFEGEMEAGAVEPGDYLDVTANIYRAQSAMADAGTMQCRLEILVSVMAFHRRSVSLPDDFVEEPLDMERLQNEPGMIGYVVKEGDDLWSIAKHFHTTKQELMTTNDLNQEILQKGQKLLVMKHIYMMS